MGSSTGKLTPLQEAVLDRFFEREQDFYLTGGAALAGFHLGHRTTDDLDLFTLEAGAFERGLYVLRDTADSLGGDLETLQDTPGFRRFLLRRGDEAVVVDLVAERVPQRCEEKLRRGKLRIDPPEEILSNKLCTLVGRAEIRDLIDVFCLEKAGFPVEDAFPAALEKDGGATPATLAWLLSEIHVPESVSLPGGIDPGELMEFRDELVRRLRRLALP